MDYSWLPTLAALLSLATSLTPENLDQTPEIKCPTQCTCKDRRAQNPSVFKVDCEASNIVSLSALNIPSVTTFLLVTGNPSLTAISVKDLSYLTELSRLNLNGNGISKIEAGAFKNLTKLERLDLSSNKIIDINDGMLEGLSKLKRLSLSGNLFTLLPEKEFSQITQLEKLDLAAINLVCDCRLRWILKWQNDSSVNLQDTKCISPDNLKNQLIRGLSGDDMHCNWPLNLQVLDFELGETQLVFAGDVLIIECKVTSENPGVAVRVFWQRQGSEVKSNKTAGIKISEDRSKSGLIILSLRLEALTVDSGGSWVCVADTDQGNKSKSTTIIVAPAFCEETVTKTDKGDYRWPRTGFTAKAELPCAIGDVGAKAFYTCNNKGEWVDFDVKACKYSNQYTRLLHELSLTDFNSTGNLDMVKALMEMMMQPAVFIGDKMDVVFVSKVLRKITYLYDLYSKDEIPRLVFNITSLMMNVNGTLLYEAEQSDGACTSLMENLEIVINQVLENKDEMKYYFDNIAVVAKKFYSSRFTGLLCTAYQSTKTRKTYFTSSFLCEEVSAAPDFATYKTQRLDALIYIPAAIKSSLNSEKLKIASILFRNDSLFQLSSASSEFFVPSPVISAYVLKQKIDQLVDPVLVVLPRDESTSYSVQGAYWDRKLKKWSFNGCNTSSEVLQLAYHNMSVVMCNHLTEFAILQDKFKISPTSDNSNVMVVMRPQFYVGGAFLCVCLLITILTYMCAYRSIYQSKKLKHSLINTCWSTLLLTVAFVSGVKVELDVACQALGISIHYFSITTIFWLTVTAWTIYKKKTGRATQRVVTEDNTAPLPPNPMLKFYLFAWGVPIIICGITGAVNINFYNNNDYCFVAWKPGLLAFYGVVGIFILIDFILCICICNLRSYREKIDISEKVVVINADGNVDAHHEDDNVSQAESSKSSLIDSEYKQMTGVVLFMVLYILMWASGAFSVAPPFKSSAESVDVILSYLYMILCFILGTFVIVFYCLARHDARVVWSTCFKGSSTVPQPTMINSINSPHNTNNTLKRQDSADSVIDSCVNQQTNPLLQIMEYHKKMALGVHSIQERGDNSTKNSTDSAFVYFNARQNGVAKRYWEKKRTSREKMNHSMISVPESHRKVMHSPTNTEPTIRGSTSANIKSHSSKQAKRHRLGSTNSEPADMRNSIYHSMPLSASKVKITQLVRQPTIGQSNTSSEAGLSQPYNTHSAKDMWHGPNTRGHDLPSYRNDECSLPMSHNMPAAGTSFRNLNAEYIEKQAYVHNYLLNMASSDAANQNEETHLLLNSGNTLSQKQTPYVKEYGMHRSHASLQSHGTAHSHQSTRSNKSRSRRHAQKSQEDLPLLKMSNQETHANVPENVEEEQPATDSDDDKMNINQSSSDNNSSHYASVSIKEQKLANRADSASPMNGSNTLHNHKYSVPQVLPVPVKSVTPTDSFMNGERIYENARNIISSDAPIYANLMELQAAAKNPTCVSPKPTCDFELPVYENLFSLNEYDTLRKQKKRVTSSTYTMT